jgi:hypothetical protein
MDGFNGVVAQGETLAYEDYATVCVVVGYLGVLRGSSSLVFGG